MLSVQGLNKCFKKNRAIDDLDFEVQEGEIFGIVGPDGAGKSTLLRILSAILVPDSGVVRLKDSDIFKSPYSTKERIAYMPQRFGLYEDLSVEENIFFFGMLFGLAKREINERLPSLYGFSNLKPYSTRLAGALSGGMKQKLGLACSLVHSPELLILDEPTNGVDPVSRREFWKILYGLLTEGVTIIISTAYLDEAERCSRIALMYSGRFIETGEPGDVKKIPGKPLLEIRCDDPRKGETALKKNERYAGVIRTGDSLKIFVEEKEEDSRRISEILSDEGIKASAPEEVEPSLEDTFVEIIAGEESSQK